MTDALISIIVPVYNVEKYVVNCMQSIANQTYTNFEVIMVNDGSTDDSARICQEWINKTNDNRFKLVNKLNGGLADARNYGLSHCSQKAEYVVFVDSDDELTEDCLSILIRFATPDSLVIGTLLRCTKTNIPAFKIDIPKPSVFHNIWNNIAFLDNLKNGIINSCCGKCYSLKIIRDKKLQFKHLLPEDTFFNVEYLSEVTNVCLIERPIYLYFIWENSMSTRPSEQIYTNYMILQNQLYKMVQSQYRGEIDRFVYPHYRVNSMNYLKSGNLKIPRYYLKQDLIKKAFNAYRPVSLPDYFIHVCLKRHLFYLAKLF